MRRNPRELGRQGEALAAAYLERKGWRILDRNYRFERAEVDLVATDGREIVFVEVKTRASLDMGYPEEAVTAHKQRQLYRVAQAWLQERRMWGAPIRFDILAIVWPPGGQPSIEHLEDALWEMS
ncbi:MAG: YraN family protein [Bacteroidetes bacterium]|nr:YraN family protein [Rhodothermia bacterium]MCS7154993.1 YraN family protein [Bacteroidota bacterium]MCX7907277.1 YraN family protein [Bacteroidota bacterium]MDW8137997.1 YraN family protein [Bacteroidota bacterium]MDW8286151.1 YraN family protein [Bacteroidota bacterium]